MTGWGPQQHFCPFTGKYICPSSPTANIQEPVDCEAQICPDLVGATVIDHRVSDPEKHCDRFVTVPAGGVDGCAALNLTTGICTIYRDKNAGRETKYHEWSHCMGWHHTWDSQKGRYEWFPMPEVLKYRFKEKR